MNVLLTDLNVEKIHSIVIPFLKGLEKYKQNLFKDVNPKCKFVACFNGYNMLRMKFRKMPHNAITFVNPDFCVILVLQ